MSCISGSVIRFGESSELARAPVNPNQKITGKVEWFNPKKHYGFIRRDDNRETVFFNRNSLRCSSYKIKNKRVEFNLGNGLKGIVAKNIIIAGELNVKPAASIAGAPPPSASSACATASSGAASTTHQVPVSNSSLPSLSTTLEAMIKETSQTISAILTKPQVISANKKRKRTTSENENDREAPVCKLCDEEPALVTFLPCNHQVCCIDCSIRMKRCVRCNQAIEQKIKTDGFEVCVLQKPERYIDLVNKVMAQEEAKVCVICMDNKKSIVFNCGHLACASCAMAIDKCHLCQRQIVSRARIFEF